MEKNKGKGRKRKKEKKKDIQKIKVVKEYMCEKESK